LIAARLKLPFDEAVVIAELLQDECRAYLDRQAAGLEDGEALLPEAAIIAAWTDMEREKFGRIGALAAALAKALGEVADGMEASGHGASAEFGIDQPRLLERLRLVQLLMIDGRSYGSARPALLLGRWR
jgi:hypothetical protein